MSETLPQGVSLPKAVLAVVTACLLVFALVAAYKIHLLAAVTEAAREENLAADGAQASLGVRYIEDHQHGLLMRLAAIASRNSFKQLLEKRAVGEMRSYLTPLTGQSDEVAGALVAGPEGRVLLETDAGGNGRPPAFGLPPVDKHHPVRPWVSAMQQSQQGRKLVTLGVPVRDRQGAILGYLALRQTTAPWESFLSHIAARPGRSYYLFDGRGGLVASGPEHDPDNLAEMAHLAEDMRRELGRRAGPLSRLAELDDGDRAFVSAASAQGWGWVLVVAQPYDEAMAPVAVLSQETYLFLGILAAGLALVAVLLTALYKSQQKALQRTGQEARRLENEVHKRTSDLRLSNERLNTLLRDLPDLVYEVDAAGRITLANQASRRLLGYEPHEMIGRTRREFVLTEDLYKFDEERARAEKGERMSIVALRHVTKDGQTRWLSMHSRGVFDQEGRLVGRRGVARDVTQQVLAERQVRELSRRLIGAQEQERKRLAQDLHDELGQMLSALKIGLQAQAAGHPDDKDMARLIRLTQKVVDRVRALAYNLRPAILDSFGLAAACRDLCEALDEAGLLEVEDHIEDPGRDLPPEVSLSVYRCLQEALNNVVRHSRSGWARVELRRAGARLRLVVTDRGHGFDVKAVLDSTQATRSLGLVGMRERLGLLDGTLTLTSSERGTTLSIEVPLEEAHA